MFLVIWWSTKDTFESLNPWILDGLYTRAASLSAFRSDNASETLKIETYTCSASDDRSDASRECTPGAHHFENVPTLGTLLLISCSTLRPSLFFFLSDPKAITKLFLSDPRTPWYQFKLNETLSCEVHIKRYDLSSSVGRASEYQSKGRGFKSHLRSKFTDYDHSL